MLSQTLEKLVNPNGMYGYVVLDKVKEFVDDPKPAYERKQAYRELVEQLRGEITYHEEKVKKLKLLSEFVDDYFFAEVENLEQQAASLEGELERSKDPTKDW